MPFDPKYIPFIGLLAIVPVVAYLTNRPEIGVYLAVLSTITIVLSVFSMLRADTKPRGKVHGPG